MNPEFEYTQDSKNLNFHREKLGNNTDIRLTKPGLFSQIQNFSFAFVSDENYRIVVEDSLKPNGFQIDIFPEILGEFHI